jgi:hypothetical protein
LLYFAALLCCFTCCLYLNLVEGRLLYLLYLLRWRGRLPYLLLCSAALLAALLAAYTLTSLARIVGRFCEMSWMLRSATYCISGSAEKDQHASAYVSIRQHTQRHVLYLWLCREGSACVSIRQHASAYAAPRTVCLALQRRLSMRQHTLAYVSIRSATYCMSGSAERSVTRGGVYL